MKDRGARMPASSASLVHAEDISGDTVTEAQFDQAAIKQ